MKYSAVLVLIFVTAVAAFAQTTPDAAALAEFKKLNAEVVRLYGAGNYKDAIDAGEKAVKSAERLFGENHLETSLALRNLGFAQVSAKELKSAGKSLGRSYDIFKKLPAADQKDARGIARTIETLGLVRINLKEGSALELFEEALVWYEKGFGPDSFESRHSLKALAEIVFARKNYDRAAGLNRKRLGILARSQARQPSEVQLALKQTQCSFRKADKEADFAAVEAEFEKVSAANPRPASQNIPAFVRGGVINGKAEFLAKPVFPAEARAVVREATVKVDLIYDETGQVVFACAASDGPKSLLESAENAAYSSRFKPTILQGNPIQVTGTLIYSFKSY